MGCDMQWQIGATKKTCFNPRTRMGCDFPGSLFSWFSKGFNPRTRMGCDTVKICVKLLDCLFQSTHPHGVRLVWDDGNDRITSFNPRTRMGCDVGLGA